jgi:hypothetical protein
VAGRGSEGKAARFRSRPRCRAITYRGGAVSRWRRPKKFTPPRLKPVSASLFARKWPKTRLNGRETGGARPPRPPCDTAKTGGRALARAPFACRGPGGAARGSLLPARPCRRAQPGALEGEAGDEEERRDEERPGRTKGAGGGKREQKNGHAHCAGRVFPCRHRKPGAQKVPKNPTCSLFRFRAHSFAPRGRSQKA